MVFIIIFVSVCQPSGMPRLFRSVVDYHSR